MALVQITLTLPAKGTCRCPIAPLSCGIGGKLIVFLKDPAQTVDGNGVIVMDIINRVYDSATFKYIYTLQFDDDQITVPSISQCDFEDWCCYDCATRYVDAREFSANCSEILACLSGFNVVGDAGAAETVNEGDTLSILGTGAASTTSSATDTVTVDVPLPLYAVPTPYFIGT